MRQILEKPWIKVFLFFIFWETLLTIIMNFGITDFHIVQASGPFLLRGRLQYDAGNYMRIAQFGYGKYGSALPVFFPLLPLLTKIIHLVTRLNFQYSALLINLVSTYFSFLYLYLIGLKFFNMNSKAVKTLLLFAFFPTAYFLFAYYSESLFCALLFGSFYYALNKKWLVSSLFLAFLTATRLVGIVAVVAVLIEYLADKEFQVRNIKPDILYFFLAPIGMAAYMIYLFHTYHDALYFQTAYRYGVGWAYQRFSPNIVGTIFNEVKQTILSWHKNKVSLTQGVFLTFGFWVFALIISLKSVKKVPISFVAFNLLCLLIFVLAGNFTGDDRYILPFLSIYLYLVSVLSRREASFSIWLASSASIMTLLAILFANGFWTE
jgi:Gpi18-like mannosyltransferase